MSLELKALWNPLDYVKSVVFFELAKNLTVIESNRVSTACINRVGLTRVNLDWIEKTAEERGVSAKEFFKGVMTHEMLHILYRHFERTGTGTFNTLQNIAADCEINQYVIKEYPVLTEGSMLGQVFGLPNDMWFEWYLENIPPSKVKSLPLMDLGEFDKDSSHEIDSGGRRIEGKVTDDLVKKLWELNRLQPPEMQLTDPNKKGEVSRKQQAAGQLVRFLGGDAYKISWTTPSRRDDDEVFFSPGRARAGRRTSVLFAFDVSGSIDETQALEAAMVVNGVIRRTHRAVDYVCWSDEVSKIQRHKRKAILDYSGGGTDGRNLVEFWKRGYWQSLIVFTDGDSQTEWGKPNRNILVVRLGGTRGNTPYEEIDFR